MEFVLVVLEFLSNRGIFCTKLGCKLSFQELLLLVAKQKIGLGVLVYDMV